MKKPIKPLPPNFEDFAPSVKPKLIKEFIYTDPDYIDEDDEDDDDKIPWESDVKVSSLQDLIDISKNLSPKDVFISLERGSYIRDPGYISVQLFAEDPAAKEKQNNLYLEALKKYQDDLAVYEQEIKIYDDVVLKQQIKQMEEKLAALKSRL